MKTVAATCKRVAGLVVLVLLALPASADVRLPAILSDHTVLQRAAQVPLRAGRRRTRRWRCASGIRRTAALRLARAAMPNLVNRAGLPAVPFRPEHPVPSNPPSL